MRCDRPLNFRYIWSTWSHTGPILVPLKGNVRLPNIVVRNVGLAISTRVGAIYGRNRSTETRLFCTCMGLSVLKFVGEGSIRQGCPCAHDYSHIGIQAYWRIQHYFLGNCSFVTNPRRDGHTDRQTDGHCSAIMPTLFLGFICCITYQRLRLWTCQSRTSQRSPSLQQQQQQHFDFLLDELYIWTFIADKVRISQWN
jgi:hypothetical protein